MEKEICMTFIPWTLCMFICTLAKEGNIYTYNDELSFNIKPNIVDVNDSITFTCVADSPKAANEYFEIHQVKDNGFCSIDCVFFPECHDVDNLGYCKCDNDVKGFDDSCDASTTSVEYKIIAASQKHAGEWECKFTSIPAKSAFANLTIFVEISSLKLEGDHVITVGENYTYVCNATGGMPTAVISWALIDENNNTNILNGTSDIITGDDETETRVSVLFFIPKKDDLNSVLSCSALQLEGKPIHKEEITLNVTFGAEVELGPCNGTYEAVKNNNEELRCTITRDGNPSVKEYEWLINSTETIPGENKNQLILDDVKPKDKGNYTCRGLNGITNGRKSSTVELLVFYHPENVAIDGVTQITEGDNLELTCLSEAVPTESITYRWVIPNGQNATGKKFKKSDVTYADAGEYTCEATNTFTSCADGKQSGGNRSEPTNITVLYTPKGDPVAGPDLSVIIVGNEHTLTCELDTVHAVPPPDWIVWRKDTDKVVNNYTIHNGETSWTNISKTVADTGSYTCQTGNVIGPGQQSVPIEVTVEAPAVTEYIKNNTEHPVYNYTKSGEFTLTCLVSASNIDEVWWEHNGENIDNDYFNDNNDPEASCENNNCSYGLEFAYQHNITWTAVNHNFTDCEAVMYYDGQYQCKATATAAGITTSTISDNITITTFFSALVNGVTTYKAESGQENLELKCNICARPAPSYQWYFSSTDEESILTDETNQTYIIEVINQTHFGTYFCKAGNEVADKFIPIELLESGRAESPTELRGLDNATSTSLTVQWREGASGNHPPVVYFIYAKSSEEVLCNETSNRFEKKAEINGTHNGTAGTLHRAILEGLQPDTSYCIRIHGENQRKMKPNASDFECICQNKTKESPVVADITIERVTEKEMTITWNYNGDAYYVGLEFEYYTEDNEYTGRSEREDAVSQEANIGGKFYTSKKYLVKTHVYEGNNQDLSFTIAESNPYIPEVTPVAAIVVSTLLLVALLVVAIGFLYIKRDSLSNLLSKNQPDEQQLHERPFDNIGEVNSGFDAEGPYATSDFTASSSQGGIQTTVNVVNVINGNEYAQVDKTKKKQKQVINGDEYAQVVKPKKNKKKPNQAVIGGDEYAQVDKTKKKKKQDKTVVGGDEYAQVDKTKKNSKPVTEVETPYEDVSVMKPLVAKKPKLGIKPTGQQAREVSEDGCVYIKVDFPKYNARSSKSVIHGKENMTMYAQIDWSRKADPIDDEPPPYKEEDDDVLGELPPRRDGD